MYSLSILKPLLEEWQLPLTDYLHGDAQCGHTATNLRTEGVNLKCFPVKI